MTARGPVRILPERGQGERIVLRIAQDQPVSDDGLGGIIKEVTAGITGNIAASRVDAYLTGMSERRELGRRVLPFVHSRLQSSYLVGLLLGVMGLTRVRSWWARLWPAERFDDYGGRLGYAAAASVRLAAFLVVFLPLAGLPAVLLALVALVRRVVSAAGRASRSAHQGDASKVD